MDWQKPLSRAGFFGTLAAAGYAVADVSSPGSAIRRVCSTITQTVTQTVTTTVTQPPPPPAPPPPPPPVPLGGNLPALLPASTGQTFYVATSGSDTTGDGSLGNPWASFQKLLNTLTAGQVGIMATGIYNAPAGSPSGRHTLDGRSGTSSNPIEVRAADGATVQIRPTVAGPTTPMVCTNAAAYWRFRGLIFENAAAGSNHPAMWLAGNGGGCTDIEWWNCEFRLSAAGSGTFVEEECRRIYYVNCSSHDNAIVPAQSQSHGYYVTGDNCMLLNCLAYNQDGYGFQLRSNELFGAQNLIVANCVAYNCKAITIPGNEHAGFVIDGSDCDGAQLWNNIAYDNKNGFRGITAGTPSPINVARKNIANGNDSTQYGRQTATTALDYSSNGSGDYVGPGDNLTSDPLLTDPANGDFTLQASSSAIGYGNQDYCPPFDFLGRARSQVDAGAYAFNPLGPQGIVTDGTPNSRTTWQPFLYEQKGGKR